MFKEAVEFKGLFPMSINLSPDPSKGWDKDNLKAELALLLQTLEEKGYVTYDEEGLTNEMLALRIIKQMISKAEHQAHLFIGYSSDTSRGVFVCTGVGMEVGVWDSSVCNNLALEFGGSILRLEQMNYATKLIQVGNPIDDANDEQIQIAKMKKEIGI